MIATSIAPQRSQEAPQILTRLNSPYRPRAKELPLQGGGSGDPPSRYRRNMTGEDSSATTFLIEAVPVHNTGVFGKGPPSGCCGGGTWTRFVR